MDQPVETSVSDTMETETEKTEVDDDDLVILEERSAPPPDLVMECIDEPLDNNQRLKQKEDAKAFKNTMKLVKSWSIRPRLQANRRDLIVMGSKNRLISPVSASLTRPPQPSYQTNAASRTLNVSQHFISARPAASPMTSNTNSNCRPPISIVQQKSLAPRGKILVRPNTTATPRIQNHMSITGVPNTRAPVATAGGTVLSNSNVQQLTLSNGQVVSVDNFQHLLFDHNSGLLIMPNSVPASPASTSAPNSTTTFSTANQIRTAIASGIISSGTPRVVSTIQRPSTFQVRPRAPIPAKPSSTIVSTVPSFTPKIISTSSLSINSKTNRVNCNSSTGRFPPPKPTPSIIARPRTSAPAPVRASLPRSATQTAIRLPVPARPNSTPSTSPVIFSTAPRAATTTALNRHPTPPFSKPTTVQYPPKQRPASATSAPNISTITQIETTNTINGSNADKDSNNNKTFPSLVVVVKPCLGEKVTRQTLNAARAELDARVKALLLHSPAKLTEWLMQQGLLRLEHRCVLHMTSDRENIKYKLGMYSDGGKQPFSGGYVWITECCPDSQISVFHGSIFESAVYTPGTIMKLIYHWSCQTSAQNVLQWVKVSSYYLKNFYTLLRSCCVAALHEYAPLMGGPDKYVEVGIITLGTPLNQVNPNHKPIKIEIVGVFDPAGKIVRMKVINPLGQTASTTQTRLRQILWPLKTWVDKESTILIDCSIDKSSISEMGFKSVIQSKNVTGTSHPTNVNIMNYLKHIIPKMFQNTLSALSKSLIQQFLDELSWRELWGSTSAAAFDVMIQHLVQMTKWELDETLISRLNKISLNPFSEWSYSKVPPPTGIDMLPDSIRGAGSGMPTLESYAAYVDQSNNGYSSSGPSSPTTGTKKKLRKDDNGASSLPSVFTEISTTNHGLKRKGDVMDRDELRQYLNKKLTEGGAKINLFTYYYAESKSHSERLPLQAFPQNLKCPLCSKGFLTNHEVVRHITTHVNAVGRVSKQILYCEFCLKGVAGQSLYASHLSEVHRQQNVAFPCYFCLDCFANKNALILHMWQMHEKLEMPYRCDCCNYKNSRHHELVEHFNKEHGGSDQVLCPVCLKVFPAQSAADIQRIVVHLQSHAVKKGKGKKCPQCVLTFATELDLRAHFLSGAHGPPFVGMNYSALRTTPVNDITMPLPPKVDKSKFCMPPPSKKTKTNHSPAVPLKNKPNFEDKPPHLAHLEKGTLSIDSMTFYAHRGEDLNEQYNCCECKSDILTPYHFPGCLTCAKCPFSTSCEKSMLSHNRNNHQVGRAAKGVASMYTNLSKAQIVCGCGARAETSKQLVSHMVRCSAGGKTGKVIETKVPKKKHSKEVLESQNILPGLRLRPKT